jgi:hypothetical protein
MEMVEVKMDNEKLVIQIKEQISLAGVQVKQRMKQVQLELLEELKNEDDRGISL